MPEPLKPLMEFCGISKGFNDSSASVTILDKANFQINSGESIAIVGASGIGKSTLLYIMGSLDKPDEGQVFYKGQDLLAMKGHDLDLFRNSFIGFVFQFHYLLQGFSALENVMIPGLIGGRNKISMKSKAFQALDKVGLGERISHRVEDLSGGEQQRTAIARAIVMEPDILLADEPTGNLDQANSDSIHALFRELNQSFGMTIILVTHNTRLASIMERQVTIEKGKIVAA